MHRAARILSTVGTALLLVASTIGPLCLAYAATEVKAGDRPITDILPEARTAPVVCYLGSRAGSGGTHLVVQISRDGTCTMVDSETRVGATGRIGLKVEGSSRQVLWQETRPLLGAQLSFALSDAGAGVMRLTAITGSSEGQSLYLVPAKRGTKMPAYTILGGAVPTKPLSVTELQARCSMNDDYYNAAWGILKANQRPEGPAVILMGNSTMREASDAALLSREIGMPVYKLAFSGATEVESLMAFRKLLWHQGDIFVLHVHPGDFTQSFSPDPNICMAPVDWDDPPNPINASRSPFELFADPKTYLEFTPPLDIPSDDELVSMTLRDCFAFYRMRSIFQRAMSKGFSPEPWKEIRYSGRDRGTVNFARQQTEGYSAIARVDNAKVDGSNVAVVGLRTLFAEAARRGVHILLLGAPINQAVWGNFWDEKTKADVDVVAKEVGLVPAPLELFRDEEHYIDHNHLNAEGRRIYTLWLGRLIRETIGGARDVVVGK